MIDKQKDNDFIASVVSIVTLLYGLNVIFSNGYLIERFSFWMMSSNVENVIGLIFALVALANLIGLKTGNKRLKRLGIVFMTMLWAAIFSLYVLEAFKLKFLGLIFTFLPLVLCLRIARRGDFVE
ncbi:hypothetical protein CAT7_04824 [Carnobacterium sp. AT7]|uniref:hypothetical protein n=1 Tax=Carnobacterium sp. AT7 TaxID=333990 RepID=UPI00015F1A0E|nr:hypothetical protein [Carnobacterium sp. AT7]EDP68561.1 hypothetical protein CAT7_04824 [Carnobacterium sp. AT7]